jgi:sporulation protein YlmC with PRC-barrel domain
LARTTMTAAFAALLASSMPMAYAADAPSNAPSAVASALPGVSSNHIMSGQIRVTRMDGAAVFDAQGKNIGDIKDIILDRQGKVAAVVLDVGSFLGVGGKFVAVSTTDLKVDFDNNNKPKFTVHMTKNQLKSAQTFDLTEKTAVSGSSTAPNSRTTSSPPAERK